MVSLCAQNCFFDFSVTNARDYNGNTPLHYAAQVCDSRAELTPKVNAPDGLRMGPKVIIGR